MSSVLVLNAGYEPLHTVSVRHAIRMIVREVAVIEEAVEGETYGIFPMPVVLRLVKYVKMHWRKSKPKFSKARLFQRDGGKCGYCGDKATTMDHIFPKSRGGTETWLNMVSSCFKCNNKKNNRTPEEANMKIRVKVYEPAWNQLHL